MLTIVSWNIQYVKGLDGHVSYTHLTLPTRLRV